MKLRWLLGNFVPREHAMGWRDEHDVSWQAHERHMSSRSFWTWTLLALVIPGLIVVVWGLPLLLGWLGLGGRNDAYLVGLLVFLVVFWVWSAWVYGNAYERAVRRALRERGVELCVECGYALTGLGDDQDRCPECGAERAGADPSGPAGRERGDPG